MARTLFHNDDAKDMDALRARLVGRRIEAVVNMGRGEGDDWFDIGLTLDDGVTLLMECTGYEADGIRCWFRGP